MTAHVLPDSLAEIRDEFLELPEADRLQLLLEFSNELPAVPEKYDGHPELQRAGRRVPVAGLHHRRDR